MYVYIYIYDSRVQSLRLKMHGFRRAAGLRIRVFVRGFRFGDLGLWLS